MEREGNVHLCIGSTRAALRERHSGAGGGGGGGGGGGCLISVSVVSQKRVVALVLCQSHVCLLVVTLSQPRLRPLTNRGFEPLAVENEANGALHRGVHNKNLKKLTTIQYKFKRVVRPSGSFSQAQL